MSTQEQRQEWQRLAWLTREAPLMRHEQKALNDAMLTLLADVDRLTQANDALAAELAQVREVTFISGGLRIGKTLMIDWRQNVQAYADYYANVISQGDAPETFDNWYNGAREGAA